MSATDLKPGDRADLNYEYAPGERTVEIVRNNDQDQADEFCKVRPVGSFWVSYDDLTAHCPRDGQLTEGAAARAVAAWQSDRTRTNRLAAIDALQAIDDEEQER